MVTGLVTIISYTYGLIRRVHTFDDKSFKIVIPIGRSLLIFFFFMYLHIKLSNLHMDVLIDKSKTLCELETK